MSHTSPIPPRLAERFLCWFLRDELVEEVQGDLEEAFYVRLEQTSLFRARLHYWYQVFRYVRPFAMRPFFSLHPLFLLMFRHNFLLTFRTFKRYKGSFIINLIGLSTGLACALLIFLWVQDERSVDKFHANDARLYQLMENVQEAGGILTRQTTSGPMAEGMVREFPEVEQAIRANADYKFVSTYTLSVGDQDLKAEGMYADSNFFNLFSFRLLQGDGHQVLAGKNHIVLSESLARSLFAHPEEAVGKLVEWQHEKQLLVAGIYEDPPAQSSLQFDFLMPLTFFLEDNPWVEQWGNTGLQTYVLLRENTDVEQLNRKLAGYVTAKTEGNITHRTPFLTRYSDVYLHGQYENGVQAGGRIAYVRLFSVIAGFILLIACINFMNLSTARASRRLKEVGIKKVVGAHRGALISQHLGESVWMALLSLGVALLLVALVLPQFNDLTEKQLHLSFDVPLVLTLLGVVLLTGVLAGSYPALYLSSFHPATVLKGKLSNLTGEVWVRKGLVVFQFTLSIILIVAVWVVYRQIQFVQTQNLGYDKENILLFRRDGPLANVEKLQALLTELNRTPGVLAASSSEHDLTGHNGGTYGLQWPGKDPNDKTEFERMAVNYGLIEMLGMSMKEGRSFSEEFGAEQDKIIFNEAAIEFMGLDEPVGKVIQLWGENKEIIGVVKDFHFDSFREEIKPAFFRLSPESTGNILVKLAPGQEQNTLATLEKLYQTFNPGFTFDYRFLDQDYQALYAAEQRVSSLSKYFAGIAVLISCLGLFGLAAFTAERRTKEIGIRKVLGASDLGIVYLLSSDFTRMVLIAIVLALPISYFLAQRWLSGFAFSIDLHWWYFAGAGLVALLVAWFTVGLQTVKAALMNPVDGLRSE
ncbi:duplicated orphan permease [Catalinimonas alkaloidigena]|uniref:Duplicated orphan permease n=1 Tax=Catalinimonas alkaloidigena TaxID=1075417 RepID=A0A1G9IK20_9BACT|nr:ABC transporter permease [Catalinimonas alkaloidigena]SDL25472.1 duplicated orphan permease [Catalinimonas alkaloidigena]